MAVIKSLCDSCDAAQTALQNIGHVWSDLGAKMDALKARILDEQIKIETSEYEAMLEELTHVDAQWAEIVEVARILADIGVFEDDTDYHMAV